MVPLTTEVMEQLPRWTQSAHTSLQNWKSEESMKRLLSNIDGFKRPSESIYFRYSKETGCWMMNVRCHRNVHLRGQLYHTQTVETLSGTVPKQEKTISK